MKAIHVSEFGEADVLQYVDIDVPVLQPNEVLIKTTATSVNFADIKSRLGGKGKNQPPFIPGLDVMGVVEEAGAEVTKFSAGDRVIAFPLNGSYAEYVTAQEVLTFKVSESIDDESAAALPITAFTAYALLKDITRLQKGEHVLVHAAAGGIGTMAGQLARLLGAGKVIGTVSREAKVKTANAANYDEVIVTSDQDYVEEVKRLTGGVDVILDSIGGQVTEQGLEVLNPYGRLAQFGNASGSYASIDTKELHSSCRSVLGFSLGTTRVQRPERLRPIAEAVLSLAAVGKLKAFIGKRFPLAEAENAHRYMEARKTEGKILLFP